MSTPGNARIIDRGYQHYQGPRRGQAHALWAMVRASLQRAIGIHRKLGPVTVLKWLLALLPFVPVVVAIVLMANLRTAITPSYATLYEGLELVYVLFAALIAPDLLCPDRRERVLTLYFAAPISRVHYIAAHLLSLISLLLLLSVAPMLVLFVGHAVFADSAAAYVRDNAADLGHLVLAGGLIALYYGAVSIAVASVSDRRAYAAGAILGLLLVSSAAAAIISRGLHFSHHQWFALLDLLSMPVRTARWFLGLEPEAPIDAYVPAVSGWAYLAASLGVIVVSMLVLVQRFLRSADL